MKHEKCERNCPDRHVGCQQTCETHLQFLARNEFIQQERKKFLDIYYAADRQRYISEARFKEKR